MNFDYHLFIFLAIYHLGCMPVQNKFTQQWLVLLIVEINDLSDFQRSRIMRAHLTGASGTFTAQLFCVSRATVFVSEEE